jgi:hypothetical protein
MLWGTCWPNESRGWGQRLQRGGGASLSVPLNMRLARYGVAPLGPWNVSGARDGAGGARPSQPHSARLLSRLSPKSKPGGRRPQPRARVRGLGRVFGRCLPEI